MEVKIVIQDWVKLHKGGMEEVLPEGTTVRFETPTGHFAVSVNCDGQLEVHKTKGPLGDDQIKIQPLVRNSVNLV